jgi:hypothetical protein
MMILIEYETFEIENYDNEMILFVTEIERIIKAEI